MPIKHDVVIVGSGIAGLRAAVEISEHLDVAVVSKVFPTRSHSGAAQGGITAALANQEEDQWDWHMFDTVKGSDYLGDQDAIEIMTRDAPRAILELEHMGVPFSRTPEGKIAQRAFGGHTRDFGKAPVKRACYASDRTGRIILDTLFEQSIKKGVQCYPEFYLLDLLFRSNRCIGLVFLELATGEIHEVHARAVLLATGGAGKIFKTTSNCFANTGDALSIAFMHNLPLQDMEFVQFHPTGIRGLGILISEAARGEGGILLNGLGERFMERYAPVIKDLAPRDIIARSITSEIREGRGIDGSDFVHLDLTGLGEEKIRERLWEIASFAKIYTGIDPVNEPVPVQPTCHYLMGGIPTDADGRVMNSDLLTHLPGLFAAGETACVSVHGANRLGCNSLLDLVVFGRRTGKTILAYLQENYVPFELPDSPSPAVHLIENLLENAATAERVQSIRLELQQIMMDHCSVYRNHNGLDKARKKVEELKERYKTISITCRNRHFNLELMEALECGHLLNCATVILASALYRKESRGAHFREDYPERNDQDFLHHTIARKNGNSDITITTKPVSITRFQPAPRTY
jgi:succinate dehydrogenase / fumarate reductase flavoprotein subunit